MEWLGILLLYVISGFLKKREQNKKRKQIESDPNWDVESNYENQKVGTKLDSILNDLFEQNPATQKPNYLSSDILESEDDIHTLDNIEQEKIDAIEDSIDFERDITKIDKQVEQFEDNIYHSKLAQRKELHFGNKWLIKKSIKKELFNSKKLLRRSIIIKEILDKPLAFRE